MDIHIIQRDPPANQPDATPEVLRRFIVVHTQNGEHAPIVIDEGSKRKSRP